MSSPTYSTPGMIAKLTVNGYVRTHETAIQKLQNYDHALFQSVLPLVTSIIIQYYFVNGYFDIAGKGVIISDDKSC